VGGIETARSCRSNSLRLGCRDGKERFVSIRLLALAAIVSWMGCLAAPGGASAQTGEPVNPAEAYRRAFALIERMDAADREAITNYLGGSGSTSAADLRAVMLRAAPVIAALREAAGAGVSPDWGIDYSAGPYTLLPHVGIMRSATQFLVADAQVRLANGDAAGAAEALAAGYTLSGHVTENPTIIATLVGAVTFRQTNQALQQALGEGNVDSAAAQALLGAVTPLAGDDPFNFVASLEGERDAFGGWMKDNFTGEGGKDQFVEQAGALFGGDDRSLLATQQFADMSQGELDAAIGLYNMAQQDMVNAAKTGDLELMRARMREISEAVSRGEYGPVALNFTPGLDRVADAMIAAYDELSMLIAQLEIAASGVEGAQSLRNAALWYLRAIAIERRHPSESRDRIAGLALDILAVDPFERALPHPDYDEILAIIDEAVKIERCDFDLKNSWAREGMTAQITHVEGMRDVARVLIADAAIALDRGGADYTGRAATRLAGALRMAAHLAADRRAASSQAAAAIFDEASAVLLHAIVDQRFPPGDLAAVRDAVSRLGERLPFNFSGALARHRSLTSSWLIERHLRHASTAAGAIEALASVASAAGGPPRSVFDTLTLDLIRRDMATADEIVAASIDWHRKHDAATAAALTSAEVARRAEQCPPEWPEWFLPPVLQAAPAIDASAARLAELRTILDAMK
jgi:hypothetical protein